MNSGYRRQVGQESNLQPAVLESGDFASVWEYSPLTMRGYTTEVEVPTKIVGKLVGSGRPKSMPTALMGARPIQQLHLLPAHRS